MSHWLFIPLCKARKLKWADSYQGHAARFSNNLFCNRPLILKIYLNTFLCYCPNLTNVSTIYWHWLQIRAEWQVRKSPICWPILSIPSFHHHCWHFHIPASHPPLTSSDVCAECVLKSTQQQFPLSVNRTNPHFSLGHYQANLPRRKNKDGEVRESKRQWSLRSLLATAFWNPAIPCPNYLVTENCLS